MKTETQKKENNLSLDHDLFKMLTGKRLRKPKAEFGRNNFKFSTQYLAAVKGAVAVFPKEIVADFIHKRCKEIIDENSPYSANKLSVECVRRKDFRGWGARDLAMLAYMIMHSKKEDVRELALVAYGEYELYLGNQVLQLVENIIKDEKELSEPYY